MTPSTSYRFTVKPYSETHGDGSESAAVEISTIGDEGKVIKIVVSVIAVLGVLLCCCWLHKRRNTKKEDIEKEYDESMKVNNPKNRRVAIAS